ncbi:hypothetical protein P7F88_04860 [Vibrio hannami]|uniref:hypothetical protein n=1 Tax=Vibrio hannami TaxID=2717094 RepID=UPI00240FFDFF|nr:hypothetical protein [Vibrio hannami]MDG3085465.1 hypothetical protein [Vibrio hannami]
MFTSNQIYFDYEPNIGVNAYFIWGHHFFNSMTDLQLYVDDRFGKDFELIEITNGNYEECVRMGVFSGVL